MTIKKFIGSVVPHHKIKDTLTSNACIALDIFQDYWKFGFDREVGRDTYLSRPDTAKESAIGRIHLRPVSFSGNEEKVFGKSATQLCWDNWENTAEVPATNSNTKDIPTSNEWVVYCVDSQRNACMLAYLPQKIDPHAFCANLANMQQFITLADEWFSCNKTFPMDIADFPHIFSDKWLEP